MVRFNLLSPIKQSLTNLTKYLHVFFLPRDRRKTPKRNKTNKNHIALKYKEKIRSFINLRLWRLNLATD